MMRWIFVIGLWTIAACQPQSAGENLLTAGPMIGHTTHRSATIWLEVDPKVNRVVLEYWPSGQPEKREKVQHKQTLDHPYNPLQITVAPLSMNTLYRYQLYLNGQEAILDSPYHFKTKATWRWQKKRSHTSFLLGSCSFINDSTYDRPGTPYGQDPAIFKTMNNTESDFMLWLGDNTYLREADYSSATGIRYRYHHTRQHPALQPFLASRPHYAIWDDHDYGPNDCNRSFALKSASLATFKAYWCNPSYGKPGHPGIYTNFEWGDAEFFLTDDRYHRAPNALPDSLQDQPHPGKPFFGPGQLQWLKDGLTASKATFKFIAVGNQMLNKRGQYEGVRNDFPYTFQQLLTFLKKQKIEGVIFLSGDRHFSELLTYQMDGFYTLYEFTCSPLTSRPYKGVKETREFDNPQRVDETLVVQQNFGKVTISGSKKDRQVVLRTYDKEGAVIWEHTIRAEELSLQ